jgi:hypothetical protein
MTLTARKRFTYKVQLQKPSGDIVTVPYSVLWSPEKVTSAEVAESCAAEYSVGKAGPHAGLTAVLVEE